MLVTCKTFIHVRKTGQSGTFGLCDDVAASLLERRTVTDDQELLDQQLLQFVPYLRPKVGRRASDRKAFEDWYKALREIDAAAPPTGDEAGQSNG